MSAGSEVDAATAEAGVPAPGTRGGALTTRSRRRGERVVLRLLWACGALSIVTTVALVVVLLYEGSTFFGSVGLVRFLTGTEWYPYGGLDDGTFGILPLVNGTLLITGIALVVAVPLGLGAAVYLSEYARRSIRKTVKPVLEVLAGIPTVVLGYFALTFMTPLLRDIFGESTVDIFNAASAGIVVGIMIIPMVASLSEDAMAAVPGELREGAYGMGATKRQATTAVVIPAALSGIVASVILAMGRAIGETMIVAIAAGNLPTITGNPFTQVQTMTAYIVQAVQGETPRGSLSFQSVFAVGLMLFVVTFGLNLIAQRLVSRYRESY